jgi:hypothetical protein
MPLNRAVTSVALICSGLSAAVAQQPPTTSAQPPRLQSIVVAAKGKAAGRYLLSENSPAAPGCTRGTPNCPTYTAPAATALPGASMDGSMNVPAATSTVLFKGAVPPNAFMIRTYDYGCVVNDNGPAAANPRSGFLVLNDPAPQPAPTGTFITPAGYKPIGPVSIWCPDAVYVAARAW